MSVRQNHGIPRHLAQHYSACVCESLLEEMNFWIHRQYRLYLLMWTGFIQPTGYVTRTKRLRKRDILLPVQARPWSSLALGLELTPLALLVLRPLDSHLNHTYSSPRCPACQPHTLRPCSLHNEVRQFLTVNPSVSLCLSAYLSIYKCIYIDIYYIYLTGFLWRTHTNAHSHVFTQEKWKPMSTQTMYTNDNGR